MNTTKLRKTDYILLLIFFIGFYLLNRFSIFDSDDFYYSFIGGMSYDIAGIDSNYIPVNSFTDAIKSNIYDYIHCNGRFIVHTLTSYFCGVIAIDIFIIMNSVIFILLITGLIKLVRSEFGYNISDRFIVLFFIFILISEPDIFWGNRAAVINYLWTSCAIVWFIFLYNKVKISKNHNTLINILLLTIGVIIGSLQESFTIGISGALFLYYCFNFKEFKGSVVWLVIGFWIGTCVVTLAPGNFARLVREVDGNRFYGFIKYISQLGHFIFESKPLLIILILTIVLYFKNRCFIYNFINKNSFYYYTILFNGIIVTIVYTSSAQLTCIDLFSIILLIKILYSYFFIEDKGIIINVATSITILLLYIPIYNNREINHSIYLKIIGQKPIDGIIVNNYYLEAINNVNNPIISRYNSCISFSQRNLKGLSLNKTNGRSSIFITAILPISQYEIDKKFKDYDTQHIYDKKDLSYYFRCSKDKYIDKIYFLAEPATTLGRIRNKLFDRELNRIDITKNMNKFQTSDYNYYVYHDEGYKIYDFEIEYKNK